MNDRFRSGAAFRGRPLRADFVEKVCDRVVGLRGGIFQASDCAFFGVVAAPPP